MRPAEGVQRGSVADMPTYPGDPLTPGVGATKDAKRLAVTEAPTITKIPVLPISYGDAQPLLAALTGPRRPQRVARWLFRSRIASARARRKSTSRSSSTGRSSRSTTSSRRLPGTTEADQWVIRGNHHDAWVNGAEDPISGQVAELEEARALGAAVQAGLASEAHHHLRRVGWRRARPARLHGMGRDARRFASHACRRVPQHRHERSRLPRRRRIALARDVHQRRREGHQRSGIECQVVEATQAAVIAERSADERGCARPRRPAHRRVRLGLGLHAVPAAPRRSPH